VSRREDRLLQWCPRRWRRETEHDRGPDHPTLQASMVPGVAAGETASRALAPDRVPTPVCNRPAWRRWRRLRSGRVL